MTIHKRSDEQDPDLDAIKEALVTQVNAVRFTGCLYASQLYDVIGAYLTGYMTVGAIDMLGRIRTPADETRYIRSSEALLVEADPEAMVTAKTVQFFLDLEDVTITVETDIPMPI
jgi:hypothetical protein